ncbi:hypothetical protein A2U01_0042310 [Trifolium medium]|uniref:Uncharacterized protein n=1 Tax=Trifolium medium TaxID=97028 RepID=A0A392QC89_9FABA|nr:hypothetical protein [Trifolium medium]
MLVAKVMSSAREAVLQNLSQTASPRGGIAPPREDRVVEAENHPRLLCLAEVGASPRGGHCSRTIHSFDF